MEFNSKVNEETKDSIHNSIFWTRCPFCRTEDRCLSIFKNRTIPCPKCRRFFTLEEYQSNTQMQIERLKEEIAKLQQKNEASEKKYKNL